MERIIRQHKLLCAVCKHSKLKKMRIEFFTKHVFNDAEVVKAITDVVHNILRGKLKVGRQLEKLRRYKQPMRDLTKKGLSIAKRRAIIVQKGGFLPFLVPIIAAIAKVGAVAGPLIAKAAAVAGPIAAKVASVAGPALTKAAPWIAQGAVQGTAATAAGQVVNKIIEKVKQG